MPHPLHEDLGRPLEVSSGSEGQLNGHQTLEDYCDLELFDWGDLDEGIGSLTFEETFQGSSVSGGTDFSYF